MNTPTTRRRPRRQTNARTKPALDKIMLVNGAGEHAHVAVLEENELVEHYVTRKSRPSLVGNIYLGRVQNVLPGMEAAFVDIGQPRNAVLYVGEVMGTEDTDADESPRIDEVLRTGQSVLVQVTKDPMGTKGARLTTHVSLAGRYLVLVPNGTGYGISRRLPDDERSRLRDIARSIRPDNYSLIVRTAAEGAVAPDLTADRDRLMRLWNQIDSQRNSSKVPAEIHAEPDLVIRVVRDLFSKDFTRLVVSDPQVHERVLGYVQAVDPDLAARVDLHSGGLGLFDAFHVTTQLRKALERKVWLPSGGYIVVDRTEALTVVDVNSGRYVSGKNLEETVFKVNLEAAEEVVRQLRLRDIGGIIIIDFIDMLRAQNREEILKAFRSALDRDKTKTQVIGISPLGLVEMTRKNVSEGLVEALSSPCPTCEGRGVVISEP